MVIGMGVCVLLEPETQMCLLVGMEQEENQFFGHALVSVVRCQYALLVGMVHVENW